MHRQPPKPQASGFLKQIRPGRNHQHRNLRPFPHSLAPKCRSLALWETNYIQVMDGVGAIIAWLHGTGLRPFLAHLEAQEQELFLDRYTALLPQAFPVQSDGRILLTCPPMFFVSAPN